MEAMAVTRRIVATALVAAFSAGCRTQPATPDTRIRDIRREIQGLTDLKRYDDARAVKADNADEETIKREMIRDVVNPAEIKDISERLSGKVAVLVSASQFDEARDIVWEPIPGRVPVRGNIARTLRFLTIMAKSAGLSAGPGAASGVFQELGLGIPWFGRPSQIRKGCAILGA